MTLQIIHFWSIIRIVNKRCRVIRGGRFLMLLIEAIFHKPVPRKVESIINTVGLVLLLGLTAVIAVKDIWQIFNGGFNYG